LARGNAEIIRLVGQTVRGDVLSGQPSFAYGEAFTCEETGRFGRPLAAFCLRIGMLHAASEYTADYFTSSKVFHHHHHPSTTALFELNQFH